jgi:hypothetical protein
MHEPRLREGDVPLRVLRHCAAEDCDQVFVVTLGLRGRGHERKWCRDACRTRTHPTSHTRTGRPLGRPRNKKLALSHKEETA